MGFCRAWRPCTAHTGLFLGSLTHKMVRCAPPAPQLCWSFPAKLMIIPRKIPVLEKIYESVNGSLTVLSYCSIIQLQVAPWAYIFLRLGLKGHGKEPNFPRFLHKSLWPRSLTLHFEPFRFWLRIRGDVRIRKTTPRIGESGSRQDCLEYPFFQTFK